MIKLTAWKCFSVVMAVVLILGVAAFAIPATPAGAVEGTWEIQTVDESTTVSTSIAVDSHGYPHIAYCTGSLDSVHYASWTGTKWETETVDDVPAVVVSLALDSHDVPRISYCTGITDSLYYAFKTGAGWTIETVDCDSVIDCSLALDTQGYPHIAYIVLPFTLKYAWSTGTGWEYDTLPVPCFDLPSTCSLALDGGNGPHIATGSGGAPSVHYYHLVSEAWVEETVDDVPTSSVSIALDSLGGPHIAYCTVTLLSLHYASRTGGGWTTQTVDPANASDCSLAMDSQDRPHISYFVGNFVLVAPIAPGEPVEQGIDGGITLTGALKYAAWTGSEWDIQTVDQETLHVEFAGPVFFGGKWCSLALDEDDLPHISFGNLIVTVTTSCHYAHLVMPVAPVTIEKPSYSPPMPNINRYLYPANMSVQYVSVNPQQAVANQPVTITTNVVNTGDTAGNYNVDLKINGQVEESRMVSVGPQASQPVKFTVTRDQPGTYTVDIVDKSGSFTIVGKNAGGGTSGQNTTGLIVLVLIGVLVVATVVVLLLRRA
jgi:hypothetical protein